MKKLIVVEGVDGCGKSTCVKGLADKLTGVSYQMPPEEYGDIRSYINANDRTAKLLFYMSANINGGNIVRALLNTHNVVCDRYYLSTICYHEVEGADFSLINTHAFILKMPRPDLLMCLTAEPSTIVKRIIGRGGKGELRKVTPQLKKLLAISDKMAVMTKLLGGVAIATDGKTPEEIQQEIIARV